MALAPLARLRFGDEAEVAHHRQRHVLERQPDVLPGAVAAPVPLGREQAGGRHLPGDEVPGRQHVVDHVFGVAGSGDVRDARAGIDRVVDGRAAEPVALDRELDQVRPARAQRLVGEPAARREVGQEQAGVGARGADDRHRELASLGARQVERDRALRLVQAAPEQADAVVGHRPAPLVEAAAERVDPDHVGAELRERHAAERRGDEGRRLDDAHAGEDRIAHRGAAPDGAAPAFSASSSRLRATTFSASVSSAPSKIDSTRASTK